MVNKTKEKLSKCNLSSPSKINKRKLKLLGSPSRISTMEWLQVVTSLRWYLVTLVMVTLLTWVTCPAMMKSNK